MLKGLAAKPAQERGAGKKFGGKACQGEGGGARDVLWYQLDIDAIVAVHMHMKNAHLHTHTIHDKRTIYTQLKVNKKQP